MHANKKVQIFDQLLLDTASNDLEVDRLGEITTRTKALEALKLLTDRLTPRVGLLLEAELPRDMFAGGVTAMAMDMLTYIMAIYDLPEGTEEKA